MFWLWSLFFMWGGFVIRFCPTLPRNAFLLSVAICLLAVGLIALYFSFRGFIKSTLFLPVIMPLLFFILGFIWTATHANLLLARALPDHAQGQTLKITGKIITVPEATGHGWRFNFEANSIEDLSHQTYSPLRLRLSVHDSMLGKMKEHFSVGDKWQLCVRLKRPHGFFNPGGFDFEGWLFHAGIRGVGYVAKCADNRLLKRDRFSRPIDRIRERVAKKIQTMPLDAPYLGLILALIVGIKSDMTAQTWHILSNTGTSHLMAISGLHIGLFAALGVGLVQFLWRRVKRASLFIPAQIVSAVAGLIFATIYSALAGFAIPTQRAWIMIAVILIASCRKSTATTLSRFGVALFLVILIDPLATLSTSFWLSFSAVFLLMYGLGGRLQLREQWSESFLLRWRVRIFTWLAPQWIVFIGFLPIGLLMFHQVTFVSLIANSIAIPWVSVVVVPVCMLGLCVLFVFPTLASWIFLLAAWCLKCIWIVLSFLANLTALQWTHAIDTPWQVVMGLLCMGLFLLPRGVSVRALAGVLFLLLMFSKKSLPDKNEMWFTLLDVGQGLSAVIQTHSHVLIFDTGPYFSDSFNAGTAVIVPFLKHRGIRRIDTLVISHADLDHRGGMPALFNSHHIGNMYTSDPDRLFPWPGQSCEAGHAWEWDGVHFRFIHPKANEGSPGNNHSCVLAVSLGEHQLLLTGDIEKQAERSLVAYQASALPSDILVAPHHGSNTSSSEAFVAAVFPDYVLFPVGYRNRYRFPATMVTSRYKDIGATLIRTDEAGAIFFKMKAHQSMKAPSCWRYRSQHVWNAGLTQRKCDDDR